MRPLSDEEIEQAKARRPGVRPGAIEAAAEEYATLLADSFMHPPPGVAYETAESEFGLADDLARSPPPDHRDRIDELGKLLFEDDNPDSGDPA